MSASNKVPENLNYLSNVSFRLTMEDAPHVTWFCQSANIPGVSIDAIEIFNPHATVPVSGARVSFEELSAEAQAKAVADYIEGWEETHEKGDMSFSDALSALRDDFPLQGLDNYLEDGTFVMD